MTRAELERKIDWADGEDELRILARQALEVGGGTELEDLARAIFDFADWQQTSYTTMQAEKKKSIERALWLEVSDRVRKAIGKEPPSPRFSE